MESNKIIKYQNLLLLLLAFISGIFLSPKWTIALAAWIHFTVLLRFYRDSNWKGYLVSIPILGVSGYIAQLDVMPLDTKSMVVFISIFTLVSIVPFLLDRLTYKLIPRWLATLILPTFFTLFNYLVDMGPQGTWGNVAYTQYSFLSLMQISSITGIYGIGFLIYWFASSTNYVYELRMKGQRISPAAWIMPACLVLVVGYGILRLNSGSEGRESVIVSTITMDNLSVSKAMYQDEFDKDIDIPKNISMSDPELAEINKGMIAFMKDPDNPKYEHSFEAMDGLLERYLQATKEAAGEGAKILTWSEGAVINIKSREEEYAKRVSNVADELDIYLFFATAVFHPEKVGVEPLFIENKVLAYDPEGQLINTYFKNIPIFGVEPSFPGDGNIPVIETPYGNLSPIICYDADHPQLIQQVSDQQTDMLVVPTGDWKAISPYHTHMAAVRCIENGVSMLKSTSNGLSAVIDDKGRILAGHDYFDDSEVKKIVYEFPIQSSDTQYVSTLPIFLLLLKGMAVFIVILSLTRFIISKLNKREIDQKRVLERYG